MQGYSPQHAPSVVMKFTLKLVREPAMGSRIRTAVRPAVPPSREYRTPLPDSLVGGKPITHPGSESQWHTNATKENCRRVVLSLLIPEGTNVTVMVKEW